MKRLLSLLLVLCLGIVGMSSCADRVTVAEDALLAVKAMDLEMLSSCVTPDTKTAVTRLCDSYGNLNAEEKETLTRLYAMLRYTMGETVDTANDMKTVTVEVTLPDISRLRSLANAQIVFGKTANESVTELLDGGTVEMRELTWEIVITKTDDVWQVIYDEKTNGAWIRDLGLSEMLAFFTKY